MAFRQPGQGEVTATQIVVIVRIQASIQNTFYFPQLVNSSAAFHRASTDHYSDLVVIIMAVATNRNHLMHLLIVATD